MSIKDRGFASQSKARRTELASKGGKRAHEQGKAHTWTSDEARAATAKGVARRKSRQAQVAALWLMKQGFTPVELSALKLSFDEFLYYGGAHSSQERLRELKERIATCKS